MNTDLVATALALAVAAGISPYATVALVSLAHRMGWIGALPPLLEPAAHPLVLALAVTLTIVEFMATLVPGVASAWEAVHAALRPPLAIALTALIVWGGDPVLTFAVALLGGVIAFGTSLTKLGARLAIDTSPEPVSNGAAGVGETGVVALIAVFAWQHPVLTVSVALLMVAAMALAVRAVWGLIWKTVTRSRRPGVGGLRS